MSKWVELRHFLGQRSYVLPAQGNALGEVKQTIPRSAQGANHSRQRKQERLVRWTDKPFPFSLHTQGVTLDWVNRAPLGQNI
jgi:hypothetical protein